MSTADFRQLRGVARTMILPLYARAVQSKRRKPILLDPHAQTILDQLQLSSSELADLDKESKLLPIVACVAATIYDRWVKEFLDQHPSGTIVEIAPASTLASNASTTAKQPGSISISPNHWRSESASFKRLRVGTS